jgi:hypothetical protein
LLTVSAWYRLKASATQAVARFIEKLEALLDRRW